MATRRRWGDGQAGRYRPDRLPLPGRSAAGRLRAGGWNITGDTYIRDSDGYFWYQGRSDDMIVSAGYNIAPAEIERALEQHPDVAECAVVGKPDPDRGMIVHAAAVLADGAAGDDAKVTELQDFVKQR
jgi:2-aminobenzoate-CoA ligase